MRYQFEIDGQILSVERLVLGDNVTFFVNGDRVDVDICSLDGQTYSVICGGKSYDVYIREIEGRIQLDCDGSVHSARSLRGWEGTSTRQRDDDSVVAEIRAPMPGRIIKVLVADGAQVDAKQPLLVIEAMKMQNELRSPRGGQVVDLFVTEGQTVAAGELLLAVE